MKTTININGHEFIKEHVNWYRCGDYENGTCNLHRNRGCTLNSWSAEARLNGVTMSMLQLPLEQAATTSVQFLNYLKEILE
jgi:hypothetical protein